jgi:glycosyltransferase involved in cell wall biosynthesis
MKAIEVIAKQRPACQFIIVGGDGVSYGTAPKNATCWREHMLEQVDIDLARVHFLGRVPYDKYRKILQVSSVHLYLTYPFVLSWSMLEAMASGCLVMASATAPVQEVISEGVNGLLVDFFDHEEWAKRVTFVLGHLEDFQNLRKRARETVIRQYSQKAGLHRYLQLFEEVLG